VCDVLLLAADGLSAGQCLDLIAASALYHSASSTRAFCCGDPFALLPSLQFLRKKGLASADKKSSRVAAEGNVWSYIHAGSRLGVLVEINCETDFVARGEKFQELVNDMAMQVSNDWCRWQLTSSLSCCMAVCRPSTRIPASRHFFFEPCLDCLWHGRFGKVVHLKPLIGRAHEFPTACPADCCLPGGDGGERHRCAR
jgi:hypothetical protein